MLIVYFDKFSVIVLSAHWQIFISIKSQWWIDCWQFTYPLTISIFVSKVIYIFVSFSILIFFSCLLSLFHFSQINKRILKILLFHRLRLSEEWSIILPERFRTRIIVFLQFVLILSHQFFNNFFFISSLHLLILLLLLLTYSSWLSIRISPIKIAFTWYYSLNRIVWCTYTVNTRYFRYFLFIFEFVLFRRVKKRGMDV